MELLGALIGVGVLAAAPGMPVLRGAAKLAVKGGMAVADATVAVAGATAAAASMVGHQVSEMTGHAHREDGGETIMESEAVEPAADDEPVADTPSVEEAVETGEGTVRPAAKAAVKGSMAVADAAKSAAGVAVSAAVVAGQQLGGLVGKKSGAAEEVAGVPDAEETTAIVHDDVEPAADDLLRVKGVGPKTVVLLNEAGITTLADLASTPVERLQAILSEAGPRYRVIDPTSWPIHAQELLDTPPAEPQPFDDTDLLPILGIGPKTASLLKEAGIGTVSQLAETPVERLQEILDEAGPRYRVIDPATWPEQAQALLVGAEQG